MKPDTTCFGCHPVWFWATYFNFDPRLGPAGIATASFLGFGQSYFLVPCACRRPN